MPKDQKETYRRKARAVREEHNEKMEKERRGPFFLTAVHNFTVWGGQQIRTRVQCPSELLGRTVEILNVSGSPALVAPDRAGKWAVLEAPGIVTLAVTNPLAPSCPIEFKTGDVVASAREVTMMSIEPTPQTSPNDPYAKKFEQLLAHVMQLKEMNMWLVREVAALRFGSPRAGPAPGPPAHTPQKAPTMWADEISGLESPSSGPAHHFGTGAQPEGVAAKSSSKKRKKPPKAVLRIVLFSATPDDMWEEILGTDDLEVLQFQIPCPPRLGPGCKRTPFGETRPR